MSKNHVATEKSLDIAQRRRLKGIGHELKPIILIGNHGVSESVLAEIERALIDHELIKIKMCAGNKEERETMSQNIATKTNSLVVHQIGRMLLLLRNNPKALPHLSNLVRFSE